MTTDLAATMTPEEAELLERKAELERLAAILAQKELDREDLSLSVARFEQRYFAELGPRSRNSMPSGHRKIRSSRLRRGSLEKKRLATANVDFQWGTRTLLGSWCDETPWLGYDISRMMAHR